MGFDPDGLAWYNNWSDFLNSKGMRVIVNRRTANFGAGLGDGATFGATRALRNMTNGKNSVDMNSGLYAAGYVSGAVASTVATAGVIGAAARTAQGASVTTRASLGAAGNAETIGLRIFVAPGSGAAVVTHERVHVFMNALLGTRLAGGLYSGSRTWRTLEELAAEGIAVRSLWQALSWWRGVAASEYGVTMGGLMSEWALIYMIFSLKGDTITPCP